MITDNGYNHVRKRPSIKKVPPKIKCDICKETFPNLSKLRSHYRKKHIQKTYDRSNINKIQARL